MHRDENHHPHPVRRNEAHTARAGLFVGGILILTGIAFLLSQLDMLGGLNPWQLWPVILIFLGVVKLFGPSGHHGLVEALILIAVGVLFELYYLGIVDLQWRMIWPIGLIAAGSLVFWATLHRLRRPPLRVRSESYLDGFVVLGGREETVATQEFEGGDLFCVMGGFELDFREARMKEDKAVLNVRVIMGGIEMRVPEDWSVIVRGTPIMGGFENKTRRMTGHEETGGQQLIIEGTVIMGGIEIRN